MLVLIFVPKGGLYLMDSKLGLSQRTTIRSTLGDSEIQGNGHPRGFEDNCVTVSQAVRLKTGEANCRSQTMLLRISRAQASKTFTNTAYLFKIRC